MNRTRRTATLALVLGGTLLASACGGGGGFEDDSASKAPASATGPVELKMLIASSGDAETNAVKAAADAWATEDRQHGRPSLVATDMNQQLAQGFASGNPPDVFYIDAALLRRTTPSSGSLYPYADQVEDNDDFYESLRQTFTYEGKQYCVPKDFSTLALQINTDSWTKAGLTDADVPTDLGRARSGVEEADHRRSGRSGHRHRHRPARRLRRPERRLVAQRRLVRRRPRTPPR